jgi:hypothetical protein
MPAMARTARTALNGTLEFRRNLPPIRLQKNMAIITLTHLQSSCRLKVWKTSAVFELLTGPIEDHKDLTLAFQALGAKRLTENCCTFISHFNAHELTVRLSAHLFGTDRIIVARIETGIGKLDGVRPITPLAELGTLQGDK